MVSRYLAGGERELATELITELSTETVDNYWLQSGGDLDCIDGYFPFRLNSLFDLATGFRTLGKSPLESP